MNRRQKPEILSPAGDFTCLQAAIDSGADAIYFGLGTFNMRARSGVNFKAEDLPEISSRCRRAGVKAYLALNAIMFEDEMSSIEKTIVAAKPHVDAFIVSDSEAAAFLAEQGASRVVLARECTLAEVARITERIPIEVECFVHGAQCVAESGRCFMSHDAFGKSACRGECCQPCRRRFLVKAIDFFEDDEGNPIHESNTSFIIEPHTVMSARDLCSLGFVDKLMAAGISSFKIEGRARNAEYVKTVTSAYRRAVDAVADGSYTPELAASLTEDVKRVFHREFSPALYFGRPGADQFTDTENSLSTTIKRHIGIVIDYFIKAGIAQVKVQDTTISVGDAIQIQGPTTGVIEMTVDELRHDDERLTSAERGTWVTLKTPRCRVGDKVFRVENRQFQTCSRQSTGGQMARNAT